MDILNIQSLISQQKIVGSGDIDPDNAYLVVGVWQDGNRKSGASNNAYPSYAIPLSEVTPTPIIDVLGRTLYSTNPAAGPNLSSNDNIYLGGFAGENTPGIFRSVFLGSLAGKDASSAWISHFIGDSAGQLATNARFSFFVGKNAGLQATNAYYSNFIGAGAGTLAANAHNSIFIGNSTGYNSSGNHVIALGNNAAFNNTRSNQFIISNLNLPQYASRAAAQAAIPTGSAGSTYLYYNTTSGAIEGLRF